MAGTGRARLDGKVSLITGSAAGLGRVAAELFAREGSRVVVADLGDGAETVTLDGSASWTAWGPPASYLWAEGGTFLGAQAVQPATFPVGVHTVTLMVVALNGQHASDTVTVTVLPSGLPGDFDDDGDVDLDDFAILKTNFGRTGAGAGEGDSDGDGDVDLDDFAALKTHFGTTADR